MLRKLVVFGACSAGRMHAGRDARLCRPAAPPCDTRIRTREGYLRIPAAPFSEKSFARTARPIAVRSVASHSAFVSVAISQPVSDPFCRLSRIPALA